VIVKDEKKDTIQCSDKICAVNIVKKLLSFHHEALQKVLNFIYVEVKPWVAQSLSLEYLMPKSLLL
jgi:hypothetical protein